MSGYSDQRLQRFIDGGPSDAAADSALESIERDLGLNPDSERARLVRALAACKLGVPAEQVARLLDWKEFEKFCAALLRAKGFEVAENIVLTKPRAQVDILARSHFVALAVDCKHWGRSAGHASLVRVAEAQSRRAQLLRLKTTGLEPLAPVILLLSDEEARFAKGTAIVPIFSLGSFLEGISSFDGNLWFY